MKNKTIQDDYDYVKLKIKLDKQLGYNVPIKKVQRIGQMLITLYEALEG